MTTLKTDPEWQTGDCSNRNPLIIICVKICGSPPFPYLLAAIVLHGLPDIPRAFQRIYFLSIGKSGGACYRKRGERKSVRIERIVAPFLYFRFIQSCHHLPS